MLGTPHKRLQQGNAATILTVLIFVVLFAGGIFVFLQKDKLGNPDDTDKQDSIETTDGSVVIPDEGDWKTYTPENGGYSFLYPHRWSIDQWEGETGQRYVRIHNRLLTEQQMEELRSGPISYESKLVITLTEYPKQLTGQDLLDWVIEWNKRPMGWGVVDVAREEILDYGGYKGISYLYHTGNKEVHYIESPDRSTVLHVISEGDNPDHREIMETFIANIAFLDN